MSALSPSLDPNRVIAGALHAGASEADSALFTYFLFATEARLRSREGFDGAAGFAIAELMDNANRAAALGAPCAQTIAARSRAAARALTAGPDLAASARRVLFHVARLNAFDATPRPSSPLSPGQARGGEDSPRARPGGRVRHAAACREDACLHADLSAEPA